MIGKEILYDHYKETVNNVKQNENKRNKKFLIIMTQIFILFLITFKSDGVIKTISDFLIIKWNIGLYFSINIIQISILISLLYCVIRYFQLNVQIEKLYPYIHKLEDKLATEVNDVIGREGKNYLNNYPKTQNIIYYCYKFLFLILFSISLCYRIIINQTWNLVLIKFLEILISSILIILNIVYIYDNIKQRNK